MNETVVEEMQDAIGRRISAGEMFTAWDITREVKESVRLPHAILKQIVHGLFVEGWMGDEYVRTLCDVGGEQGPAWVYHRERDRPEHYVTDRLLEILLR
jgi:hypothetical protein